MKKYAMGGIFILIFFIIFLTKGGMPEHIVSQVENSSSQHFIEASNNTFQGSEIKREVVPLNSSNFVLPYVGYVYGIPNNTVAQVMLYWCYPKTLVNQSVAVTVTMNFGSSILSASYNGRRIPVFYHGYLGIILPINFSQLDLSAPGSYKFLDVQGTLHWIQEGHMHRIPLNLGNWTFETAKEEPELRPNITAFSLENLEFNGGMREVEYSFGLYNPLNTTIRLVNVSFKIPSNLVRIIKIEVYNASTPYEIDKSRLVSSKTIPPKESRYFVITLRIDGKVRSLFIQPKLVYSVGNKTYAMPGPPFQDTALPMACTYNMKTS